MSEVCELLVTTREGQLLAGVVELRSDGSLVAGASDGYENLVSEVMDTPVLGINREEDAKLWFEALPLQYSGSYFRAAMVGDVNASTAGRGVVFRGVSIEGFSGPEEEMVQAYMSRIPPELIVNVKKIVADPKLDAIHGRYRQGSQTIYFNPKTFTSRVRLGKGPAKIPHAQLTMVHEFGHALYTSLPEKLRDEWRELSGWMRGTQEGQEIPYTEKRPGWPHMTSEWTHRKGTEFTRHYAEKNPDEDAADTFAFCLLSKPAQAGSSKRKWMADLMMSMIRKYPRASIQGPETTGS